MSPRKPRWWACTSILVVAAALAACTMDSTVERNDTDDGDPEVIELQLAAGEVAVANINAVDDDLAPAREALVESRTALSASIRPWGTTTFVLDAEPGDVLQGAFAPTTTSCSVGVADRGVDVEIVAPDGSIRAASGRAGDRVEVATFTVPWSCGAWGCGAARWSLRARCASSSGAYCGGQLAIARGNATVFRTAFGALPALYVNQLMTTPSGGVCTYEGRSIARGWCACGPSSGTMALEVLGRVPTSARYSVANAIFPITNSVPPGSADLGLLRSQLTTRGVACNEWAWLSAASAASTALAALRRGEAVVMRATGYSSVIGGHLVLITGGSTSVAEIFDPYGAPAYGAGSGSRNTSSASYGVGVSIRWDRLSGIALLSCRTDSTGGLCG